MLINSRIFVTSLITSTLIVFILSLVSSMGFRNTANKIIEDADVAFLKVAEEYLDRKYILEFYINVDNTKRIIDILKETKQLKNKTGLISVYKGYRLSKRIKQLDAQSLEYSKMCKIKDQDYIYNLILY